MEPEVGSEKLHQFIASLSEEDRRKYSPLIEEALRRDRVITENSERARTALKKCLEGMLRLRKEVLDLQETLMKLNATLRQMGEASEVLARVLTRGPSLN
jgi:hypothetical protein